MASFDGTIVAVTVAVCFAAIVAIVSDGLNVIFQSVGAVAETAEQTVVYIDNLPQPPPDRTYQVWLIPAGGQPVSSCTSPTITWRANRG